MTTRIDLNACLINPDDHGSICDVKGRIQGVKMVKFEFEQQENELWFVFFVNSSIRDELLYL